MSLTRSQIKKLFDQFEGELKTAFEKVLASTRTRAQVSALEGSIRANDLEGALRAAGVREGMWGPLTEEIRTSYAAAGSAYLAADVPAKFGAMFNLSHPTAEAWLRGNAAKYVTGHMAAETRTAIRETIVRGVAAGRGPRSVALDIVGRVSKQTGKRTGGLVLLTGPQAQWVSNARTDLDNLSGRYFTRTLRPKRFDAAVQAAIETGTPLPASLKDDIITNYQNAMLKHRGDAIARTEALASLNAAGDEALQQIIDEGLAPAHAIKRIWKHSYSANERPGHKMMEGDERAYGEAFINPLTREVLMRPGDGEAGEVINCRCYLEHKIDFAAVEEAGILPPGSPSAPRDAHPDTENSKRA